VDPAQLDEPFEGRTALLSPFDRVVFDRKRTAELFRFEYQMEMYKPAVERRWGYWALPVLHHDGLVGRSTRRLIAGSACCGSMRCTRTRRSRRR
jgi:uncharacterized protein YcaQ